LGYINQADAERPSTPFSGIASYSKIFSIKDPDRYAIFDARVSASLNAIQLIEFRRQKLLARDLCYFEIPQGQK